MKVSEYVIEYLSEVGVDTIFGQIGGFNADLIDALELANKQKFVLNYHEQGAAFAANAYAMVKENVSVATSSGAPSSCNLIGGIANAFFDSIPCLFLVGSVHSKALRKSPNIRQNAFEEIDMVSLVSEIIKFAVKVTNPHDIRFCLEKALHIAKEGRKGPVLIDIPYDIARSEINPDELKRFIPDPINTATAKQFDEEEIIKLLHVSKKPLILLGGGSRSNLSRSLINKFLDSVQYLP
jgi:acetolactate synthase-1/2/3 large subunit